MDGKKTNKEVLQMAEAECFLLKTIYEIQARFFGHVMRKHGLENIVTTGMIEGTRARGRQNKK